MIHSIYINDVIKINTQIDYVIDNLHMANTIFVYMFVGSQKLEVIIRGQRYEDDQMI